MIRCLSIQSLLKVSFVFSILLSLCSKSDGQIVKPFNILPDFGGTGGEGNAWHVYADTDFIYVLGYASPSQFASTPPILARFDYEGKLLNLDSIIDTTSAKNIGMDNLPLIWEEDKFTWMVDRWNSFGGYSDIMTIDKNNGKIIKKEKLPPAPGEMVFPSHGNYYKTSDDRYIVSGYIGDAADLFVVTLDSSFQMLSQFVAPLPNRWNFAGYFREQDDNSFILVGISEFIPNNDFGQPYLMHLSPTGELLEFKLAPDPIRTINASGVNTVILDNQGNWILSGILDTTDQNCHTCTGGKPFICSISHDFNTLKWIAFTSSPPYDFGARNLSYYLTEASDHTGYVSVFGKTKGEGNTTFISKVSLTGDSLWTRTITPLAWEDKDSSLLQIWQIASTPYNTFVGTGNAEDGNGRRYPWLFQLDSLGCLVPGCDQTVSVSEPNFSTSKKFKIYPRPATDIITILFQDDNNSHTLFTISLLTMDGKLIRKTSVSPDANEQFIIPLSNIPSGEYIMNFRNSDNTYQQSEILLKVN